MVIELSEEAAARVAAAARARGVSETTIVEELTQSLATATAPAAVEGDALDAFIGCGSSGDRTGRTIHERRDELSAAQLRDTA